ncbi:MAG: S-layer family protein [Cyanobacteriota bacterium]|nr:S-layer family protein [Cyanobacteriota bacterium]
MQRCNLSSDLRFGLVCAVVFWGSSTIAPVRAQITPDTTLPNNSIVLPDGNVLTIEGGTEAGSNLFHSFEDFSISTGSEAFFNNATSIENIITRVTGGNLSDIDGLIRANGTANLFLINPNGIQFGPNASLDIGGSFLGSTAESLLFEDGSFYSATEPNASPLLSINVPVGLQMGTDPGAIAVEGIGHQFLPIPGLNFARIDRSSSPRGLQVEAGNTLALLGGDVTFDGGILTAEAGQIEVGSVAEGEVSLTRVGGGWNFDYQNAQRLGNIEFVNLSALDASSPGGENMALDGGGSIQLQGDRIAIEDSVFLIQNQGTQPSGNITIDAADIFEMRQVRSEGTSRALLTNLTVGEGNSGDISVSARQIALQGGPTMFAIASGTGNGGNIEIEASDSLILSDRQPTFSSSIEARTFGPGNAGDITVTSGQVVVRDGASINAATFNSGFGGNVTVDAESIEVAGIIPETAFLSFIGTVTLGEGNAGALTIDTSTLTVLDGARVSANTLAEGSAGNLIVNASESIEILGIGANDPFFPSSINATAARTSEAVQQLFGLPPVPTGESGSITINTPQLRVAGGSRVSVQHDGTANAGNLEIGADSIFLDDGGRITATSASGEGGNLTLDVTDSLQLRDGSSILVEAGGTGDGGNLTLNAETIALLENSRITANAFEGAGGNIDITTSGLFVSPNSQITASSQFGIDGIVTVNNPVVDPASGLVALSSEPLNPNTQIQDSCDIAAKSRFAITGRGGLPEDPSEPIPGQTVWQDTRLGEIPSHFSVTPIEESPEEASAPPMPLVEATRWQTNDRGQIELVAVSTNPSHSSWQPHPECDTISQNLPASSPLDDEFKRRHN